MVYKKIEKNYNMKNKATLKRNLFILCSNSKYYLEDYLTADPPKIFIFW